MKVILLQDVAKIGRRSDIVEVPHGFALNKLIPQRLAEEATGENLKRRTAREGKINADREVSSAAFKVATEALKDKEIEVAVEANETGHMFEALKPARIVAALAAEGIVLNAEHLHIGKPIKSVGAHEVMATSGDDRATFTVNVVKA